MYDPPLLVNPEVKAISSTLAQAKYKNLLNKPDKLGDVSWSVALTPGQFGLENENRVYFDVFQSPGEILKQEVKCETQDKQVFHEFLVVNNAKAEHCLNIYEKFLNFDAGQFKQALKIVRSELNSISGYKKTFYCFLCDAKAQRFMDEGARQMMIEDDFCRALIVQKEEYLRFMHIIFVEFADSLLQFINCHETDGAVFTFPFENFLTRQKRRVPLIQRCLASAKQGNFLADCWFICNKFSLHRFSNFWEGELHLYDRILVVIKSFLRKLRIED